MHDDLSAMKSAERDCSRRALELQREAARLRKMIRKRVKQDRLAARHALAEAMEDREDG